MYLWFHSLIYLIPVICCKIIHVGPRTASAFSNFIFYNNLQALFVTFFGLKEREEEQAKQKAWTIFNEACDELSQQVKAIPLL